MRTLHLPSTVIIAVLLLSACASSHAVSLPTAQPAPNVRLVQAQNADWPTREWREVSPTATSTEPPQPSQTPTPACPQGGSRSKPQHVLSVDLDYEQRVLQVSHAVRYRNFTRAILNDLAFIVEANESPRAFELLSVMVNGQTAQTRVNANRLDVELSQALFPGCEIVVEMAYRLRPPRVGQGLAAYKGYYGHSERQLNLAYWTPYLAPYNGQGWTVHEPRPIGEQMVLEQANWDVTVRVEGASEALVLAMPGRVEKLDRMTWRAVLENARDFPLSMSEQYRVLQQKTPNGIILEMYAFADSVRGEGIDGAQHALNVAAQAYAQYESLFGPTPYERVLVVQGDFPDGMEFSALVFVSTNWFYQFRGGYDNYLTAITVHEISHQWWYARVGNDAAHAPWLDEALATYSEYVYYEEYHPTLKDWWWSFRVGWYAPQGFVDSTIYEFVTPRDYINAVYLRGVQMLQNIRNDIGTQAFFRLLEEYARAADGRIGTPRLFWSLLSPEQYAATANTRGQFLRLPQILEAGGSPTSSP